MNKTKKIGKIENYLWLIYNRVNRFRKKCNGAKFKGFHFPFFEFLPQAQKYRVFAGLKSLSEQRQNPDYSYSELFSYGLSDDEIVAKMISVWDEWQISHDAPQKRNGTTKDNSGKYVGSGNGRCSPYYRGNRVRVPSKKRKNRMKQFLKLFPA